MLNQQLHNLGAPDPEAKTSPIMEETDEQFTELAQELEEQDSCYFNNAVYDSGSYACSGSGELLHCEKGIWVREGGCDPGNS